MSKPGSGGFTLLEVTLSMAILTVMAVGTMSVMTSNKMVAVHNEEKMMAMQVLEKQMAQIKERFVHDLVASFVGDDTVSSLGAFGGEMSARIWRTSEDGATLEELDPATDAASPYGDVESRLSALFSEEAKDAKFIRVDLQIKWQSKDQLWGRVDTEDTLSRFRTEKLSTFIFKEQT